MARIGNDLNLFELLAKSGSEFITTDELASKTRADALLLSMETLSKYFAT